MLTAEVAEKISLLNRDEALRCLSVEVKLDLAGAPNDDDGARRNICMGFLYETLRHAVIKGFSWLDVCRAVELSGSFLSLLSGKDVVEAAKVYQKQAAASKMDNRSLVIYTEFFFSTLMQHYKLFQYIMTLQQDEARYVCHMTVEPPIPAEPLKEAKLPSLHEYEQRLKEIQSQRVEVPDLPTTSAVAQKRIDISEDIMACAQTEAIQSIITKVIEEIGHPLTDEISQVITSTYGELDIKLQETTLARPKQLGPPPRYHFKAGIQAPKSQANSHPSRLPTTSAKGERKKSANPK